MVTRLFLDWDSLAPLIFPISVWYNYIIARDMAKTQGEDAYKRMLKIRLVNGPLWARVAAKNFFVRLCNGDAAFPQLGQFAHQIYLDFPDFGMVKLHYSPSYGKNARRGCL